MNRQTITGDDRNMLSREAVNLRRAASSAVRAYSTRCNDNPYSRVAGDDPSAALHATAKYHEQPRLMITDGFKFILVAILVVGVFFTALHAGMCSGFAPHSPPFPEPFAVEVVVDSIIAQEFGALVSRLDTAFVSLPVATTAPATQAGSPYADAYRAVIAQEFGKYSSIYASPVTYALPTYTRTACSVSLALGGVTATDAPWFRPVAHTCRAVTAGTTPVLVDVTTDGNVTLATLTGDVVLLFQSVPFMPLVGNAFVDPTSQPLVVQVDSRLRALFAGVTTTVTATATIPATVSLDTLVYRPLANQGTTDDALTYVAADLDASDTASDNWGALALLQQTMHALQHTSTPRDRTAFVVGTAQSILELVRMGTIANVRDVVLLTACGLVNGRDALYSTRSSLSDQPLLSPIATTLVLSQKGYLSGAAVLVGHPAWQVSSWSPGLKTVGEAAVAGGVVGVEVSPTVTVTAVSSLQVSVPTLIAQLLTLQWMVEAGALSPTGISALFR
jgi:hypothetical protein